MLFPALLVAAFATPAAAQTAAFPAPERWSNAADPLRPRFAAGFVASDVLSTFEEPQRKSRSYVGGANDLQALVVLGDRFSLASREVGPVRVSLGFEAAVHARFRLEMVGRDMLSSDWYVGVPVELSLASTQLLLRPYHHSAHMGDEALLRSDLPTIEATEERFEALVSHTWSPRLRTYAGSDVMWGGPADPELDPRLHAGLEVAQDVGRRVSLTGGMDVYGGVEELRLSLAGGVSFPWAGRTYTVALHGLRGPTMMGQFPLNNERAWGIEGSVR